MTIQVNSSNLWIKKLKKKKKTLILTYSTRSKQPRVHDALEVVWMMTVWNIWLEHRSNSRIKLIYVMYANNMDFNKTEDIWLTKGF